ncbi:MAG TPA: amino acid ABC transporter permease [Dietzia timorensis]|uniref:Amino acid ABC transporter permease n=1 Tax=Dietzia timorensis TaxID=499555 RepID=A0A921F334_9ACTN|nr:amino acid ABC transporter permease [Dietzia timorensis]HJE90896.1 amino acid ABC transporter permease [Dietzia timorensis]
MSTNATVLYDAPGPKARKLYGGIAVASIIIFLAIVAYVLVILGQNGQLEGEKWSPFLKGTTWTTYILPGLVGTIVAAVLSIVLAMILGLVLAVGRMSQNAALRWISSIIVELFRAIPVLLLMIFAYQLFSLYQVFPSTYLALAAVVFGLTFYNGSVIAEIIRSGVHSLPKGQNEAAVALGLRPGQTMRMILLPQAITAMLPAIVAQMVIALKDSALGYIIGYVEVVRSGIQSASYYRNYLAALFVVAVIMIILNYSLTKFAGWLERRVREGRKGKTPLAKVKDTEPVGVEP